MDESGKDLEFARKYELPDLIAGSEMRRKLESLMAEKVELTRKADADKAELTRQLEDITRSRTDELATHKATLDEIVRKLEVAEARIKELESKAPSRTLNNRLDIVSPASILGGEVARS